MSRVRWGRGRSPDPGREGTVYRAGPGLQFHRPDPDVTPPEGLSRSTPPPRSPAPASAARPAGPRRPPVAAGNAGPRGRRRRWPWVVALVAVVVLVYPVLLGSLAWSHLARIPAMPTGTRAAAGSGQTYLVVGSDSRAGLSRDERAKLGTGQVAGQRTDTIMLLHVPAHGAAVLVSVPRDSYVPIPGHGKNKINAAFAFGGAPLLVQTLENVTGVHIDGFVMTGLGGFADIVDAVGGVRVCVKTALNDSKAHIDVAKGCQQMDGTTALGYARARYADPRGDLGRVERQRQVLAAIASTTLSPSVLFVPWRAVPAATAGGNALTTDDGMSPVGVAQFVLGMRSVSGGDGVTLTVPVANAALQTPAGEAVEWDRPQALTLFKALQTDDLATIKAIAAAK